MTLPRPTSLRLALLCLVAVAAIPAYTLLGYTALELKDRAGKEALQDATQLTRTVAYEQDRVFRDAREFSEILSRIPAIADPVQHRLCGQFLAEVHKTMPRYGNFGVATPDGNIFCSAVQLSAPVNITDRAYFRRAIESKRFAIGEYLIGRVTGKPSITVGYPLFDIQQKPLGVVFVAIDLAWLNEALRQTQLPAGSSVRVIDGNGTILAAYPAGQPAGSKLAENHELMRAMLRLGQRDAETPDTYTWISADYANVVKQIIESAQHSTFVWAELSRAQVNAEIGRRFNTYLLWIGIATLLVFVLAWMGSNTLVISSIKAVADAAKRFAAGDLSARVSLERAPAEIAGLAKTFDRMAEGVATREQRITQISGELARTNRILRTLSGSNRTLLRAEDEQTLLGDMCRVAVEVGGFRAAWVGYSQDDAPKSVKPMAYAGLDTRFFESLDVSWENNERGGGICGQAIRENRIITANRMLHETGTEPWWEIMERHGIASAIALPLQVGADVIGVMAIYAAEEGAFTDKDFALLEELAADLSFGIATIRARSEHARTEAALHHLAMHDPGTGLPNQTRLHQWLDEALQTARNAHYPVALVTINLPRMREIGDILGQYNVNQCINRIAASVRDVAGSNALVARSGRFTLSVAREKLDVTGAIALAERLTAAVRQPFELGSCSMEIESRLGIAVFPGHAADAEGLVGRSSLAAQHAQTTGRAHAVLDTNPEEAALQRLTMLGELRKAIDHGELAIHYQPKVEAASGRIVGAEALVRWNHPVRGMIPPGEFIQVAEHTGLIIPMTHEVLRIVGRQMHAWRQEHGLSIPVAVNLSALNLHDTELKNHIDGLIGTWGLERHLLEIEITESTLMRDPVEAMDVLTSFSRSGMHMFIDDFGTGYSSLAYLASLPVHALKIDRSFVTSMMKDAQHRAIVHSILSLAGSLDLKVVAEGVETPEQADILRSLSCDELQGYLFSRPLPPDQFIAWALSNA